jgi:N-acetylmuramoyl-L-alanine amidase
VPSIWPAVPTKGPAKAIVSAKGVVLPRNPDGTVTTPCSARARVDGKPLLGANVVLDPGHGGAESGAVGSTGLTEKDLNLAVANETKHILEQTGATVVLTRTADYRMTLLARASIAVRLEPQALVSIHHNAAGADSHGKPGTETYYQVASPEAKRLGGLLYEELLRAFSAYTIPWIGASDAGAKYRANGAGLDFYGVLRLSAPVPAALVEAAYLSNPPEEALLATPAFRHVEAQAIADAIIRFVTTKDPGSGFVTPRPRTDVPAGGGSTGCLDPPL